MNCAWTRSRASVSGVLLHMYIHRCASSLSSFKITFENSPLYLSLIYRRSSSFLLLAVHPDAYIQ